MYLFLPGCPSFHRFMVVYHDLSIYPSYPSITNCIFPTILEPGLSDIMATFAWVVIVRLPRATLPLPCKNPGDSLRLSEQCQMHKLYRLRFMHENPFGPKTKQNRGAWLYHGCPSLQKRLWPPSNFKHIRRMHASEKCLNSANEQQKWHLSSLVAPLSSSGHLLSSSPGIYLTVRHREFYFLTMIVSRLMRQNPVVRTTRNDFWLWIHEVASQKRYKNTLLGSDIHGLFIGTLEKSSVLFDRAI